MPSKLARGKLTGEGVVEVEVYKINWEQTVHIYLNVSNIYVHITYVIL